MNPSTTIYNWIDLSQSFQAVSSGIEHTEQYSAVSLWWAINLDSFQGSFEEGGSYVLKYLSFGSPSSAVSAPIFASTYSLREFVETYKIDTLLQPLQKASPFFKPRARWRALRRALRLDWTGKVEKLAFAKPKNQQHFGLNVWFKTFWKL